MNRRETAGVLAVMCSTWPYFDLTDETANVWESQLRSVLVVDALEAAAQLARSSERFPTLRAFIEASQAAARRRALDTAHESRQLPSDNSPFVSDEEGLEWVRRVRKTVADARARSEVRHVDGLSSVGESMAEVF